MLLVAFIHRTTSPQGRDALNDTQWVVTFAMSNELERARAQSKSEWDATLERAPHRARTKLLHKLFDACVRTRT